MKNEEKCRKVLTWFVKKLNETFNGIVWVNSYKYRGKFVLVEHPYCIMFVSRTRYLNVVKLSIEVPYSGLCASTASSYIKKLKFGFDVAAYDDSNRCKCILDDYDDLPDFVECCRQTLFTHSLDELLIKADLED